MSEGERGARRRQKPFILACVAFAVFFFAAENLFAPSFQNCVADNSSGSENQYHYNGADLLAVGYGTGEVIAREIFCTGRFIDRHNGLFAVIAAFMVAWFTYTLKQATDKLWVAGNEALRVTEGANVFLERVIIVPGTLPDNPNAATEWQITPCWKNCGSTVTKNAYMHSSWGTFEPDIAPDFTFPDRWGENAIKLNEPIVVGPEGNTLGDTAVISVQNLDLVVAEKAKIYIWGWVEYNDIFKGTPDRRTEYCNQVFIRVDPRIPNYANFRLRIHHTHSGADDQCYRKPRPAKERANSIDG